MKRTNFDDILIVGQGHYVFLIITKSQETQKTIDPVAMLVSQTKEIIKYLLLIVPQHGRRNKRQYQPGS